MHESSMKLMVNFVTKYLDDSRDTAVIDIGSSDVNGSYASLFSKPKWLYKGLDISKGKNVDIVSVDPYNWPVESNSFDVVISGQCMEHVEAIWLWAKEFERVCKVGGKICIIAPWNWSIHRYPLDCWRILPDGMEYIMTKHCNFEKLECGVFEKNCFFIGQK